MKLTMENDKIYFLPGMVVTLKQDIPNKPIMMVLKKETVTFKHDRIGGEPVLKGIKCRWFTANNELQEAIFNTKDLIRIS